MSFFLASAIGHSSATAVAANVDLVVFLFVGILAGAHCLGMCGPLVGLYSDRMGAQRESHPETLTLFEVRQHALFNSGRVLGYAAVGAGVGLLGGMVFATADSMIMVGDGLRGLTGFLLGGIVMLVGLGYALQGSRASQVAAIPGASGLFRRVSGLLTQRVDRLAGSSGIVALGLIHAILPCPIIYPAYLYAFAMGDPLRGGIALAVLGIGTFPSLFAYGTVIGTLSAKRRLLLHRALGVVFFALGYILLSHGLGVLGIAIPHVDLPYYQPLKLH